MKNLKPASLLLAVAMVLCSSNAMPQQPAGEVSSPVAQAPRFSVGDTWTFGMRTQEVKEIKESTVIVYEKTMSNNPLCGPMGIPVMEMYVERDNNWTAVKITDAAGAVLAGCRYLTDKPLKYLDFPLTIGKTWSFTAGMLADHGKGPHVDLYTNEMMVESYEDVTIAAGTFKTFKIKHSRRVLSCELYPGQKPSGHTTVAYLWYAPEAKHVLKSIDFNNNTHKLNSYHLK